MSHDTEQERWLDYLRDERDSAAVYRALAEGEKRPGLAEVYRRLAAMEERHARLWEEKLAQARGNFPPPVIGWRSRALTWVVRRFGPEFVLPAMIAAERRVTLAYQTESGAPELRNQEASHIRVLGAIASAGGLEGGWVARLEGRHRAIGGNALRAAVLGVNDGLVSNLSLVMGVAGANLPANVILITGLAGLLAGACSMAMGEWLSVKTSSELYQRQIDIEAQELREAPEEETEELALIYQAKGLPEDDARRLAKGLMSDQEKALDALVREELGINPDEQTGAARQAAAASFSLFVIGAAIPVIAFLFLAGRGAIIASVTSSAVALFVIGATTTLLTGRSVSYSGLRQLAIGSGAAAVTYGTGSLLT
jgi:VIT1/CCC1 family predicted Fe2+/Mn2+ transporter